MSKLRRFAHMQECTLRFQPRCDNETVVAHHYHRRGHGKIGGKPHDLFCVHACAACHVYAHMHPRDPVVIERTLDGMIETQMRLLDAGLVKL